MESGRLSLSPRKIYAILILIIICLGAVAVYYSPIMQGFHTNPNPVSSEGVIEQKIIYSVATVVLPPGVSGLNPTQLYAMVNSSIVTVTGVAAQTTLTRFGPISSIASVLGTGFSINYNGSEYIITNFHVIDGINNATVTFADGDAYRARIVGSDQYADLAVLSVNAPLSEFHPLQLAASSNLLIGETVVAVGNPYGLSGTVTVGVVSQVGRSLQETDSSGQTTFLIPDTIQFSAPINPGNSGGPLIDPNGQVTGITTAAVTGSQGLGFAIPADTITRELPYLVKDGSYTLHPNLGADFVDMDYDTAQAMHLPVTYGVLVEDIAPGGAASNAGLRASTQPVTINGQQYLIGGDVIVSINGTKIVNYDALSAYLERHVTAGQSIQVGIIRAGNQLTITLTVGAIPST
jgi:S1-C subfamily serine protease